MIFKLNFISREKRERVDILTWRRQDAKITHILSQGSLQDVIGLLTNVAFKINSAISSDV